jgi:prepilin-type N-terminal cleavage/methylation domain-containing protein
MTAPTGRLGATPSGFTFIEVLQALSLSAIGLLALSSLTMGTIHANAKARRMTTAATLAQAQMEAMRNLAYGAIVEGSNQVTEGGVTYTRSWAVCTNCPIQGAREVTLTVQWADQGTQTIKLETVISDG